MSALCLDVSRGWSGLRVALSERLDEGWVSRGYEQIGLEPDELERIAADLQFLLGRANLVGEMGAAAGDEIVRLATLLFDALVPPALKPVLRRGRGELVLRLDESLHHIPWELLHTGEDFLARQYALSREIVAQGIVEPPPRRVLAESRRVLIVADPRSDLPAATREGALLREAFTWRRDVELGFLGTHVTRAALREVLREYDLVHLAGHAEWDGTGGGWLLADGRFEPDDLRRLQGTRPMPALVFANACSSGAAARPDTDGMARVLLAAGAVNYVGTLWDIPDDVGILFAVAFYERLLDGESVGEAMRRARLEMAERFGEGTALWGSYVLYGPPGRCYFAGPLAPELRGNVDVLEEAQPGRRIIRPLPPPPPSPIEPRPVLRGAAAGALVTGAALREHVARLQRATTTAIVLVALACLAFAGWLALYGTSPRAATPAETVHAAAPTADDGAAVAAVGEPEAGVSAAELEPSAPVRVPVGASLQVIAQLRDAQGHLREVPLRDGDALHSGDRVRVHFETSRDAHAYVFFVDGHHRAQLLFPSVDGDAGEVSGGLPVSLPEADGWYALDERAGPTALLLAVSERPIDSLPTLVGDINALLAEPPPAPPTDASLIGASAAAADPGLPPPPALRAVPLDQVRARIDRDADRVVTFELDHRP